MSRSFAYRHTEVGSEVLAVRRINPDEPKEHHEWGGLVPPDECFVCVAQEAGDRAKHIGLDVVGSRSDSFAGGVNLLEVRGEVNFENIDKYYSGLAWVGVKTFKKLLLAYDPDASRTVNALSYALPASATRPDTLGEEHWSVCIIKPDAYERDLVDQIYERIDEAGLEVVSTIHQHELDADDLQQIWPEPAEFRGKPEPSNPWWDATVEYMTQAPVDILLINGPSATESMKDIKEELRVAEYGEGYQFDLDLPVTDRVKSVIHTSDCNRELFTNVFGFWSSAAVYGLMQEVRARRAAE